MLEALYGMPGHRQYDNHSDDNVSLNTMNSHVELNIKWGRDLWSVVQNETEILLLLFFMECTF